MDYSQYKDIIVYGVRYHYYHSAPESTNKPTLLFLHGFPSTSEHWFHQVAYFSRQGYGIIALDMLGYGGSSKPEDPKAYERGRLAAHCIAILDAENVDKVIVVAHDWGSNVASKLANLYPERHLASIFLALWYTPPSDKTAEEVIESAKETFGRDIFSYWKFLGSEEAPRLVAEHGDSFYSLGFTSIPSFMKNHFCPDGELKNWLLEDRRAPFASWAPDRKTFDQAFGAGGWVGPTNWYRSIIQGVTLEGDKAIPKDRYKVEYPVLLVTALRDPTCLPSLGIATSKPWCTNLTVRELDTGHWVMLEKPDEVNATIDEFLHGLNL